MIYSLFDSIFDPTNVNILFSEFILCIICSLVVGIVFALMWSYKTAYSKSFVTTLAIIPSAVAVIILLVNGNIGTGIAIAGAFSLVRFRSLPGTAKEICGMFISMAIGFAMGVGYVFYGAIFALIMGVVINLLSSKYFKGNKSYYSNKVLRITIPEDLDYTNVFDDIFNEFVSCYEIVSVKSCNLGSLFKVKYTITLKDIKREKEFIDKLRERNGNLEISISTQDNSDSKL